MINWKELTASPTALELIRYGRGASRRTGLRIQRAFSKCKDNARRRGIRWQLPPGEYARVWRDDCEDCGVKFSNKGRGSLRSLDRINSKLPYRTGNVRFICYACNGALGLKEIIASRKKVEEPCL